jgi:hypothetical protein
MKRYRGVEVKLHAFLTSVLQVNSQKRKKNHVKEMQGGEVIVSFVRSSSVALVLLG